MRKRNLAWSGVAAGALAAAAAPVAYQMSQGRSFTDAVRVVTGGTPASASSTSGTAAASATPTAFYINNLSGSNCSDSGPGSMSQPWCTFTPANAHGAYGPGDSILLARGATWNQQLDLTGTGSASAWITLGAYGTGANPKILRNQGNHEMAVRVTNPDYWSIQHLEVGKAANGILVYFTTKGHQGLQFSDIFAHDNKGIAGSRSTDYPTQGSTNDPWAIDNHINESAGILVTTDLNLKPTSATDYVLKGAKATAITGTHNNNTLTFVGSSQVSNGSLWAGFQDIDVSLLSVTTDDGHAAAAYQNAGLGCANSMTLVGTIRTIVRDSSFNQGAACHTTNGTAQIFIGFVQDLTFVNNMIIATPYTASNDMTGLDFEYWEKNVVIRGNYFAGNAGPGLEVLDIHGDSTTPDMVTATIDGNTFTSNMQTPANGSAAISQGGNTTVPTLAISNNLYTEPYRGFFGGEQTGGTTQTNNQSVSSTANYAAAQFSSVQGDNQWSYQYVSGGAWVNLPNYSSAGQWYNTSNQYIGRSQMAPTAGGGVARVWTAPYAGTVRIRGRLLKADVNDGVSAGNGVSASIVKVSGSAAAQIWPASGGPQVVAGTDEVGYSTSVESVSVAAGDKLFFIVGSNGSDDSYDTASWAPSIGYTSSPTVPYNWTFSTPMTYEGWQGAQQILPSVANGALVLTSTGTDPFIYSQDNLNIPASVRYLHIRLRNQTADTAAAFYFTTTLDGGWGQNKVVAFTTAANASGYTNYVVDMGASPNWTGTIKQLRFDPFSSTGTMLVDSVYLSSN